MQKPEKLEPQDFSKTRWLALFILAGKNTPLPRLFVSMMQGLGMEVGSFASGAGTLQGLEFKG